MVLIFVHHEKGHEIKENWNKNVFFFTMREVFFVDENKLNRVDLIFNFAKNWNFINIYIQHFLWYVFAYSVHLNFKLMIFFILFNLILFQNMLKPQIGFIFVYFFLFHLYIFWCYRLRLRWQKVQVWSTFQQGR